jgi:hypothetical protein
MNRRRDEFLALFDEVIYVDFFLNSPKQSMSLPMSLVVTARHHDRNVSLWSPPFPF